MNGYLAVAEQVTEALNHLSEKLFQELLNVVQEKLTVALQEILEQPLKFRASRDSNGTPRRSNSRSSAMANRKI